MEHIDLHKQLEEVRKQYNLSLEARLKEISELWKDLENGEWQNAKLKKLHFLVHKLAGSGGTFGHADLSEKARQLETLFLTLLKEQQNASIEDKTEIASRIQSLIKNKNDFLQPEPQYTPPDLRISAKPGVRIYLVEDDTSLADEISLQLKHFGYHVEIFHDLQSAEKRLSSRPPAAIIMDIVFPEGDLAGPEFLESLRAESSVEYPDSVYFGS